MLACTETCTLFHRRYNPATRQDDWESQVLHGVSWYAKQGAAPSKDGLDSADTLIVRIPVETVPQGLTVSPGDMIVKGETGPIASLKELTGKQRYTVTAFRDNRRGVLHHYRIEGKA